LTPIESRNVLNLAPNARVFELPVPLDAQMLAGLSHGYNPDGPFAYIGRIDEPHKGVSTLLRAWATSNAPKRGAKLVIAGAPEPGVLENLERLKTELSLDGSVQFVGAIFGEEKLKLLRSASAFVLTSQREGLPLGPIEAMAMGIPVIVSDATNLQHLVEKGPAGIVVSFAVDSIVQGIDRFLELSTGERQALGAAGREVATTEFAWSNLQPRYVQMYEQALGVKR
jgi:poly(glycerol-phosphate) alpha-glucosyltransferase